jgi:hypothetical protein
MKFLFLAPAVLPSEAEVRHKMRFFLKSCERWGIKPHLYGIGTKSFPGYQRMKLDVPLAWMADFIRHNAEYTHVIYSDSWDVVCTGPLDEIIDKYRKLGSPAFLASAANFMPNVSDEEKQYPGVFKHDKPYAWPQVGGYVAEIPHMMETFRRMIKEYSKYNDDSFAYFDAIRDGWWHPVLDSNCDIFQVRSEEYTEIVDGVRIRNTITGSMPCLWHICGGFTSHTTGTDERMTPIAEMLGLL